LIKFDMNDCVFCRIAAGSLPCYQVYEDDKFLAFLDINPGTIGHTLVIPKQHYRWVYDVPDFGQYWQVAQKITLNIKNSSLKPEFISFLTMGNDVPHAHIHLIPRHLNDNLQPVLGLFPHQKLTSEELVEIKNKIKLF